LSVYLAPHTQNTIISVKLPNEEAAVDFAYKQVGKKYDYTAILGMLMRRDWKEDDDWFCSELVEAILAAGGRQRFRDAIHRITPHQSWSVI
jgi:uncharacterized protein YycO